MPTHVQVTQSCRSRGRLARAKCSRTLAVSTLSRCSPLDFQYGCFSLRRQRKVGAPPHRGNANRPPTIQGKAKAPRTLTKSAAKAKTKTKTKPLPLRRPKRHPHTHIHIPIIKFRRCHNMLLRKECKQPTAMKISFGNRIIAAHSPYCPFATRVTSPLVPSCKAIRAACV